MDSLSNLPKFYVGQKVVYITGLNMPKGGVFTVLDIKTEFCCGFYYIKIDVESQHYDADNEYTHIACDHCGKIVSKKMYSRLTNNGYWAHSSFRPLIESPFPSLTMKEVVKKEQLLTCMN